MSIEDLQAAHADQGPNTGLNTPDHRGRPRRVAVMALLVLLALVGAWWLVARDKLAAPTEIKSETLSGAEAASAPASTPAVRPGRLTADQLERMVAQAAGSVAKNPRDPSALAMLAHSQEMLGRFEDAAKTYRQLAGLVPKDAQVLADFADALGVANGRSLTGEPAALIKRALAADPNNVKALMLAGSLALEQGDKPEAVAQWKKAKAAAKQPQLVGQIEAQLAAVGEDARPVAAGAAKVSGRVWLARELMGVVSPDAVVYVMVRPADGSSRMPLALLRKRVKELPANFVLDDSNAMVKGTSLAQTPSVVLVARVSTRGDVSPQAGDLQGVSPAVPMGSADIKLEINEVLK